MDLTSLIGILAAVFGGTGAAILFYRHERNKRQAEARKLGAEAGAIEAKTLDNLWSQVVELIEQMRVLEARVTVLEAANLLLRNTVERFRDLVRRLWVIVCENNLEADGDLAEAVIEAIEDSGE